MIQWSSAETPGRARSRRRVGEAADAAGAPMPNAPILVEDDEDDVEFSSERAYVRAQAKNKARVDAHRSTRVAPDLAHLADLAVEAPLEEANRARGTAMEDLSGIRLDPLEWRLGPGGGTVELQQFTFQSQGIVTGRRGRPARSTIDLTAATPRSFGPAPLNEDCVVLHEYTKNLRKRKPVPEEPVLVVREVAPEPTPAPLPPPPPAEDEYRFKCAICMEDMKEETSTICGHIFCGACIKEAIQAQKKCPTCRKKLGMKNIHRIYL